MRPSFPKAYSQQHRIACHYDFLKTIVLQFAIILTPIFIPQYCPSSPGVPNNSIAQAQQHQYCYPNTIFPSFAHSEKLSAREVVTLNSINCVVCGMCAQDFVVCTIVDKTLIFTNYNTRYAKNCIYNIQYCQPVLNFTKELL